MFILLIIGENRVFILPPSHEWSFSPHLFIMLMTCKIFLVVTHYCTMLFTCLNSQSAIQTNSNESVTAVIVKVSGTTVDSAPPLFFFVPLKPERYGGEEFIIIPSDTDRHGETQMVRSSAARWKYWQLDMSTPQQVSWLP